MTTPLLRKSHLYVLRDNKKKTCMMGFYYGAKHGNYMFIISPETLTSVSREDIDNNVVDVAWLGNKSMRAVVAGNAN